MTSRGSAVRWGSVVLLAAALLALAGACRPRSTVRIGPSTQGRVAAVLPYEIDDTAQPLPDGAQLCYADGDCQVHTVRACCPACRPQYLAANAAARNAIGRFHESHPCPREPCPDPMCAEVDPELPPMAVCLANRCTLSW